MNAPVLNPVAASKFMTYLLRHKPEAGGIDLDAEGWTDVDGLLRAMTHAQHPASLPDLLEIVQTDDKGRYGLSPDGRRIRANQGHSTGAVAVAHTPAAPPQLLFHGTVAKAVPAIQAEGLRKMTRHHVHLSPSIETATRVGQRRGKPVIFTVRASAMHEAGHAFYRSENGVWLVEHVPPEFLFQPDLPA